MLPPFSSHDNLSIYSFTTLFTSVQYTTSEQLWLFEKQERVLYCTVCHSIMHTREPFLQMTVAVGVYE